MGAIIWIILGLLAGLIISNIRDRKRVKDYIIYSVVGVIGSFSGGFVANLVTRNPVYSLTFSSFIVALFGTVVFLAVLSAVQRS